MRKWIWLLLPLWTTACFEEDELVTPHQPGDVETVMIPLTKYYAEHVFFDLGSGQAVLSAGKLNWDLGFEPGESGWRIYLNTTRFMQAGVVENSSFETVKDTSGVNWNFDASSGNPDSTAIGIWVTILGDDTVSSAKVYIIDMGYDALGNLLGFRKFMITAWSKSQYTIRYAKLDGSDENTQQIPKTSDQDMICYSMRDHKVAMLERPPAKSWDLWFTQYTTMLYTNDGTPYPYLVTGVLSNWAAGVKVARETGLNFAEIDYEMAQTFSYSGIADRIGYDWKYYDFNAGSYSVDPGISYLVKTVEGAIFKLRFIGFYNNLGEKGYPTIEFQRL